VEIARCVDRLVLVPRLRTLQPADRQSEAAVDDGEIECQAAQQRRGPLRHETQGAFVFALRWSQCHLNINVTEPVLARAIEYCRKIDLAVGNRIAQRAERAVRSGGDDGV
jgi:hypothetical protein